MAWRRWFRRRRKPTVVEAVAIATGTATVQAVGEPVLVSVASRIQAPSRWLARNLPSPFKWLARFDWFPSFAFGIGMIQVDEYLIASLCWTLSFSFVLAKITMLQRPAWLKVSVGAFAVMALAVLIFWTDAKRSNKAWSSLTGPKTLPQTGGMLDAGKPQSHSVVIPPPAPPPPSTPEKPPLIQWGELLWAGGTVIAEIGDELPEHASGSLLLEGQAYAVQFRRASCEWESSGAIRHPTSGVINRHLNKAGPKIKPHLDIWKSATATSQCYSPRDRQIVVAGLPATFNAKGELSFGGSSHRIGRLREPVKKLLTADGREASVYMRCRPFGGSYPNNMNVFHIADHWTGMMRFFGGKTSPGFEFPVGGVKMPWRCELINDGDKAMLWVSIPVRLTFEAPLSNREDTIEIPRVEPGATAAFEFFVANATPRSGNMDFMGFALTQPPNSGERIRVRLMTESDFQVPLFAMEKSKE